MSFLHDLCRRSISFASPSPTSPSRPSEIISTTAFCPSTLRDHRRLNSRRQLPMRVPPDQSAIASDTPRSEEHTSELQSPCNLVCRLLLEKKKNILTSAALQRILDSTLGAVLH